MKDIAGDILLMLFVAMFVVAIFAYHGCTEGAVRMDVKPEIPPETIKIVVQPEAVKIAASAPSIEMKEKLVNFEPGAIVLNAPVQNDIVLGKWGVLAAGGLILIAWMGKSPIDWLRTRNPKQETQN